MDSVDVPVQCFLSYTRADNLDFDAVVDRIKSNLSGRFQAATGRSLQIFVDRDSIGWGADWRASIRASVESATFFLPVVSARYFQSDACREELLAFYESAKQLGVTDLILPIVLAGGETIRADHPSAEVRLIESLNYKSIAEAWENGYQSSQWRQMIGSMVRELAEALQRVESDLAGREVAAVTSADAGTLEGNASDSDADATELIEHLERIQPSTQAAQDAMQTFIKIAVDELTFGSGMSNAERQARIIRGAGKVAIPANKFLEKAARLEADTLQADAQLRGILKELDAIPGDFSRQLSEQVRGPLASLPDLSDGLAAFNQIMGVLRTIAVTNVSLRKAIQPAIKASQFVRNAFEMVESWRSL